MSFAGNLSSGTQPPTITMSSMYLPRTVTVRIIAMSSAYHRKCIHDDSEPAVSRRLPSGYCTSQSFERVVKVAGKDIPVKLDPITVEQSGAEPNRPAMIQGLPVAKPRGVDLAFDFSSRLPVSGELPDGGLNRVTANVTDARAYIAMKGITMWERKKEKDAYDIYFTLPNCSNDDEVDAGDPKQRWHDDLTHSSA